MPFKHNDVNINRGGRPKSSKNILPLIRQLILTEINSRWKVKKHIKGLSDELLAKLYMAMLPKDINVTPKQDVMYISQTPRPELGGPVGEEENSESRSPDKGGLTHTDVTHTDIPDNKDLPTPASWVDVDVKESL